MHVATAAAQIGLDWDSRTGAVTVPIYQTATFRHPGLGQSTGYDYSRSGNPTRQALEDGIARLDGGCRGFAYASGMAAIASILLLFRQGDHLVVTEDLYGGTYRLFEKIFNQYGLEFTYVDTSDEAAVRRAWRPTTRALFVESLTNPLLKVADIGRLAALCRERGALCIVDNTFLTPYLLRPLDLGADIALYSGSKYLAGHNDTICGLVTLDAVYPYARNSPSYPELLKEGFKPHTVKNIYLYGSTDDINYRSDITDTFDIKIAALKCHKSQVGEKMDWVEKRMRDWAKEMAKGQSFKLAEEIGRAHV